MRNQTINLNLIPTGVMPVVHLSQHDEDVDGSLIFNIYNGVIPYDLTGCVAHIQGVKPDGTVFDYECTVHDTYVTSATEFQMTTVAGDYEAELRISNNGSVVGTLNFVFSIERSTTAGVDWSRTDIPEIMDQIEAAETRALNAASNAEDSADDAADSATAAEGSAGDAADSATAAATSESNSEAWAVGQRNGVDVESTDPTYQNNSKYYSIQSGNSATAAATSEDNAEDSAEDAEAWAVGKRNGVDVPTTDPTYHNNSKYYSESVGEEAETSEAWAAGTRGGQPVPSTDPAYHNNSKYWAQQSAGQTLGGLMDVDIDNPQDGDGIYYDPTAQKWKNGQRGINHFVSIPTVTGFSFTYDGTAQGPTITWSQDESDYVVITNATKTDAGTYTLTIALKNTNTSVWADLTTASKTYEYTIAKAAGSVTLSANSVTLDPDHLTATVTVSNGTGALSFASSDTAIATVSPSTMTASGGTLTISSVNDTNGSATVNITVAASDNYLAATGSIAVSASFISNILNDNSWATIKRVAQAGTGANYWAVGDRKAVTINGTVGIYTFNNETYYAYILGFNHNQEKEGTAIHFQFGFDALEGGEHIAFCDSSYDRFNASQFFNMNPAADNNSSTNVGGWNACKMRTDLIPAFISALPSALQSALKAITKYTDNTGNSSNVAANVTATSDKVFLLAEYEIFGSRRVANQYEQNSQAQYDYYKNGNSKVMYQHTSTSTAKWWERSAFYNSAYSFCMVYLNGNADYSSSGFSFGFAPGFAVG